MKQFVVISGKGGTGKTSITAALAGFGPHKVLADCDVDAADLHLILQPQQVEGKDFYSGQTPVLSQEKCTQCGLCASHCRFDAIRANFTIAKEHCEGCGVCEYICPEKAITMVERMCGQRYISKTRFGTLVHARLGVGEENSGKLVTSIRKAAKKIAEEEKAELVLIDGAPGIGCPVIASLSDIDGCLLVMEPTLSAIHDAKRVHQLTTHFNVPCMAIINKCGINPPLEKKLQGYCAQWEIPILGLLPYDKTFTQAQINAQTVAEYAPHSLGKAVEEIWKALEESMERYGKKE